MTKCNDILNDFPIEQFRHDLIQWFLQEQRDLPWRGIQNPYFTWISEIMLQQTRVDTVIPYFNRFIERFPTPKDLAEADEEEVLKLWEGLGYYSRARNLQTAVREVHEQYGGVVPKDKEELGALKGVGPYTLGAILSIGHGIPHPAVDGNVMRVLSRVLSIHDDIAKVSTRKLFESCVEQLISHDDPSSFNQGLMELGAMICTPQSPSCLLCPVRPHCRAFHNGEVDRLPVKVKKQKVKILHWIAFAVQTEDGKWLIHKRPSEGLLANLWEFPMISYPDGVERPEAVAAKEMKKLGVVVKPEDYMDKIVHKFSHLEWNIYVYRGTYELLQSLDKTEWAQLHIEDVGKLPISVSHQKILKMIQ